MKQLRLAVVIAVCFFLVPAAAKAAPITISGSTTQVDSPHDFSFQIQELITGDFYSKATLSGSITVTPDARSGSASAEAHSTFPSFFEAIGLDGITPTSLLSAGTLPCVATGGVSTTCLFDISVTFAPTFFDSVRVITAYEQIGRDSTVLFSLSVELLKKEIPEPATGLLLLGSAVVTALGARRRQRRG